MDPLKMFSKKLDDALKTVQDRRVENERRQIMSTVGQDLANVLIPSLMEIAHSAKMNKQDIRETMEELIGQVANRSVVSQGVDTEPIVEAIKSAFSATSKPNIIVNAPPVDVDKIASKIKMPDEMKVNGDVNLKGIDVNHPLPVQIRDAKGNLVDFSAYQGGGGIAGMARAISRIGGIDGSAWGSVMNPDNRLRVEIPTSASAGLTDAELRATHLDVLQLSGAVDSVYVTGIFNSTTADVINPDNRIKVELPSGASGLTDTELRATHLDVQQLDGAIWSVSVKEVFGSVATDLVNPDGRLKVELPTSAGGLTDTELRAAHIDVFQLSGAIDSVKVTGFDASVAVTILNGEGLARDSWLVSDITASVKASLIDSSGVAYGGDNPLSVKLPTGAGNVAHQEDEGHTSGDVGILSLAVRNDNGAVLTDGDLEYIPISTDSAGRVKIASIANSTAASLVDSSGVGYNGANPLPTYLVGDSNSSTKVVGPTVADSADDGSAPVQSGGVARTTNPTAVADNDIAKSTHDDLGRQVMRPMQVRDLMRTAYVSLATGSAFGTETTLLASGSAKLLDLVYIMGANDSDAAIQCQVRASTGGTILMSLELPAGGTAGVALPVPLPAPFVDHTWTIDLPDVTGTNVQITALFTEEV